MKSYLNLCAEVMVLIPLMISGPGCAQTYVPRRYYGTTYTAVPRVYTCQPAVTYRQPVVTYSQPRAAEISRQIERQTAEIEARVKRQTQEIEERVRRQTEEIERQFARQTAEAAGYVAQSARGPTYTVAATGSGWMGDVPPGITYFPHVALGNGFVPHVFANDMAALLVWPVSIGDDVGNAVRNLVAVNDYLRRTEPEATIGMILLVCSGRVPDEDKWLAQGVRCIDASQFPVFSAKFFSQATSQPSSNSMPTGGSTPAFEDERENSGESTLDVIVAKAREWGAIATNFLQTAPWWIWASGVALLFVVVFLLSVRDARSQPFQTNGDDPWVVDPSGH